MIALLGDGCRDRPAPHKKAGMPEKKTAPKKKHKAQPKPVARRKNGQTPSAMREAKTTNATVIRRNVAVKTNGAIQTVNMHICPLQAPKELAGRLLVVLVGQSAPATTLDAYCLKNRSLPPTDRGEPGHILLQFVKEC